MGPGIDYIAVMAMALPVAAVAFFGWLALRYVRTRERVAASQPASIPPNDMTRLQELMASLQAEVHTLQERVEFVETLLERPQSTSHLRP